MSARGPGRAAALPPAGYVPRARTSAAEPLKVVFIPEERGEPSCVYDFAGFPVTDALKSALATAFAQRTRPSGGIRAACTAHREFTRLRQFAEFLAGLPEAPAAPFQVLPGHIDAWVEHRSHVKSLSNELASLFMTLRKVPGLNPRTAGRMSERLPQRIRDSETASYSRAENQRIVNAARADVRAAAERIRAGHGLAERWRAGQLGQEPEALRRRGEVLAYVLEHDDVPRQPGGKPRVSLAAPVAEIMGSLHLNARDVGAFAVLLAALTGQNHSTIAKVPAAHHRPDGYTGTIATAIVEMDKPRRGALRHMDVPLVDLPAWIPVPGADPQDQGDLRTPFGVYMLLHELAGPARARLGSERLFCWWVATGHGRSQGRGFRDVLHDEYVMRWSDAKALVRDRPVAGDQAGAAEPGQLRVTLGGLRLTHAELHQKAVAHTPATLVNDYLVRNRGNIAEYRAVVATALAGEVAKAKTIGSVRALSLKDAAEARQHPARVAARHGMDAATLTRLLGRELDTVMAGCVDELAGPHNPGRPCRASFILCLSCPCARAAPHHLAQQIAVHDELSARRPGMVPSRWAERYALPHAQLADLLDRAGPAAVADARASITDHHRRLAERFLNRELDQR